MKVTNWSAAPARHVGVDLVVAESSELGRTRAAWPRARLIALVHGQEDPMLGEVLARGVDGIIDRDDSDQALAEAVGEVLGGGGWVSPQLAPRVLAILRAGPTPRMPVPIAATLTSREHDVARLAAAGLTNSEIAGELHVAVSTVKFHMSNVLSKLGCRDRAQLVVMLLAGRLQYVSRSS